ncbi:MAG: oligosaccharide flippase family protein [Thermoprotei archaeon]
MTRETTRIARGATAVFSGSLVSNLLNFAFYIVITHYLPLGGLGTLYALNLVEGFAMSFLLLQLPGGFSRFIVGYTQTKRLPEARYLFRRGVTVATAISSISAPALVLATPLLAKWVLGSPRDFNLFYLMTVDFVFYTYTSFLGACVPAKRIFGISSVLGVVTTTARVGLGIALIFLGFGVTGVLYGWIASDVIGLGAYLLLSRDLLFGDELKNDLVKVVKYSMPFFVANGMTIVLQNVDRLFVLKYIGVVSLGVYGTLLIASNIPKILPSSLSSTLYPAIIKFEEESRLTPNVVASAVRYMAMVNLPILGLVAAVGEPLLRLFLGGSFAAAWIAFSILVFGGGAMSLDIPIVQVLLAKKQTKVLAIQQLVSSLTLAILAIALIPKLYLVGAASAYVLARIAGFIVTGSKVYRLGLFRVKWRDYIKTFVTTLALISATLGLEHFTGFTYYLLPVYLFTGSLMGIVCARLVGLFYTEDYSEIIEFFPSRLKGIVDWVWGMFGLPKTTEK